MHFYLILLVFSIITLITLATIFWRKKNVPGAHPFSLLMIALAIWSIGYYFEVQSTNIFEFTFWAKFEYFGIVLIPITWLVFVIRFTGQYKFLTRRNLLLLSIEPAIILMVVWSSKYHYFMWHDVQFDESSPLRLGKYDYGTAFWFNAIYTYLVMLAGSILLVQFLLRYRQAFRSQMFALLIGLLAPWICNLLYLSGANPLPNFDLTLLGFTITGLAVSLALLRYRFLDILPVAHSSLIENMSDGLLVLDDQERIIEVNPAAVSLFRLPLNKLLTLPVSLALTQYPDFINKIRNIRDGKAEVAFTDQIMGSQRIFELRISPLNAETERLSGKMVVLRDITERIETTEILNRRDAILDAIRFAASEFMKGTAWQKIIPGILAELGEVLQASRAYIFMNHLDSDGNQLTSKLHEWTAPGIQSQLDNLDLRDLPVFKAGYARWHQMMSQGLPVHGIVDELPEGESLLLERLGVFSIMVMPIFVGGSFWGFIGFDDCLLKRVWSSAEIDALEAAASTIGSSIQRQQVEEQLLDRLAILDALYQTSLEIAAPHDLPALLRTIVVRAVKMIEGTSGGLYLRDVDRDVLVCMVSYQTKKDLTGCVLKIGEGAAGKVAQTGKALIIDDYRNWEGRALYFEEDNPFISVISAPMTWQDQILGVIHVLHDEMPSRFSDKDLTLLSLFANQAAVAIQNTRSLQTMQLRARRLAIINEITRISLEVENQEEVLERLTDPLGELINSDSCFIVLRNNLNRQVIAKAAFGLYKPGFSNIVFQPGEFLLSEAAMETRSTIFIEEYFNSTYNTSRLQQLFPEIQSVIAVPLTSAGDPFGVVVIAFHQVHHFTIEEIELCEQATAQVALAMDKTHLIESAQHRADELDALRATVADISGEFDIPLLLSAILQRAATLLDATGGDLGLYDPQNDVIQIVVSHNMGKDFSGTRMKLGEGVMGLSIAKNEIVVIEDYMIWEGRSYQYSEGNWHAAMAVPLRIGSRILGALGIVDSHQSRSFTDDDQRLLQFFAHQAAIAIENAHLYAEQKQSAKELGILYESSALITKSLDLNTVFRISAEQLCKAVNSTSAFLLTCDLENGMTQTRAEYFSPEAAPEERLSEIIKTHNLFEYPRSIDLLRRGRPQVIRVSDPEIDPKDRDELVAHGVKSALEVPMMISGRVLGFTDIWESREDRIWSEEEIRVCQTISNQAAIAIDNAHLYNEILQVAVTDMLTGILNRRGLFEAGQRELNRTRRLKRPLSAIMLDIDHFKLVNDAYSHTVGDQVLRKLVGFCQSHLREIDIIGRYGGEEFVILLPDTQYSKAHQVAERLRMRIAKNPIETDKGPISITVSMGITCTMDGNVELAALLDRADSAMYSAKNKGRNRIASLQPGFDLHI